MKTSRLRSSLTLLLIAFCAIPSVEQSVITRRTRNVIVVTTDGFRWQEVFEGADRSLLEDAAKSHDLEQSSHAVVAERAYGGDTTGERRSALMPFLWKTVASEGQIFGNHTEGSDVVVTNGANVSYPGYSELLTGVVDPHITSNEQVPNPNVTVLEWLNRQSEFAGKVAAFGAWNAFSGIFNARRCGFPVNSGYDQFTLLPDNHTVASLNRLKASGPKAWEDEPFDAIPFYTALEYIKSEKPRVAFIGLGETDDWAHDGNYPEYLNAAHRADEYVAELWMLLQSMPEYRNSTTIIFTTDHGRGDGSNWSRHGADLPESRQTWFAVLGPDLPALGERHHVPEIHANQLASTIASLLQERYESSAPTAGPPIQQLLSGQ